MDPYGLWADTQYQPIGFDMGQPGGGMFRAPTSNPGGAVPPGLGDQRQTLRGIADDFFRPTPQDFVDVSLKKGLGGASQIPVSSDDSLFRVGNVDVLEQAPVGSDNNLRNADPNNYGRPSSVDNRPPTPRNSGATVDRLGTPTSAEPSGWGGTTIDVSANPQAKPSSLPQAAGRLGGAGIGGAADFALRIVSGQSVGQAAYGASGATAGSIFGAGIGTPLGPLGAFVGGVLGGMLGGAISDLVYSAAFPITRKQDLYQPPLPSPFEGGQSSDVEYQFRLQLTFSPSGYTGTYGIGGLDGTPWTGYGPFGGARPSGDGRSRAEVYYRRNAYDTLDWRERIEVGSPVQYDILSSVQLVELTRSDGQPDTGGSIPGSPDYSAPPTPGTAYTPQDIRYDSPYPEHPNNPQAVNTPPVSSTGNGSPNTSASPSSHNREGRPSSGYPVATTNPDIFPSNLGGNLPNFDPQPNSFVDPNIVRLNTETGTIVGPETNPNRINQPSPVATTNYVPYPGNPVSTSSASFTPFISPLSIPISGLPSTTPITQVPTRDRPAPVAIPEPSLLDVITALQTRLTTLENNEDCRQGLVILQQIQPQINDQKNRMKEAVCEEAASNECLGNRFNDVLNAIDSFAPPICDQTEVLNALSIIDEKLGEQLDGGIGGYLANMRSLWEKLFSIFLAVALDIKLIVETVKYIPQLLGGDLPNYLSGVLASISSPIGTIEVNEDNSFTETAINSTDIDNAWMLTNMLELQEAAKLASASPVISEGDELSSDDLI